MSPRVVLVGPMGSGKSTVGALVAAALGVAAGDTDALVEQRAGRPVATVFAEEGEAGFRALEREVVRRALAEHDGVLSLGGGAVLDPGTRRELVAGAATGAAVVALAVSWEHAAHRLGAALTRPLLTGDPRARWEALLAERARLYAEVASTVIDTDGLAPHAVAERVVAVVERAGGS